MKFLFFFAILALSQTFPAYGSCHIDGASGNDDVLTKVLEGAECPSNVTELRLLLQARGLQLKTTLVANRGFHNPSAGSNSLFEMAVGTLGKWNVEESDFFFGHFTEPESNKELSLAQRPERGSLMVEMVAWDFKKEVYNFYELIGDGQKGQWHFRGDSIDIFKDNKFLHRQKDPSKPVFGKTLRCAGCHVNGGPIMKELNAPHNDWWKEERGLPFGKRTPDQELASVLATLVPAEALATAVLKGNQKLEASKKFRAFKNSLTLQEELRPLFCPMEINLDSDPGESKSRVEIPSSFRAWVLRNS